MGWYLMRQRLRANASKFPLIVELEPLFQCNLACSGCGKIQHPEHELQAADAGRAGGRGDRGVRRADGVDRRRRAADPPRDPRDRATSWSNARSSSTCARTRCCWRRSCDNFKPSPVLLLGRPHRRPARAPRRVGRARGRVRQGGRARSRRRRRRGFRVTTNTTFFTHDSPKTVREVLDFLNDELRGRRDDDLARLRLREGARPGALPGRDADAQTVQRGVRGRKAQDAGG